MPTLNKKLGQRIREARIASGFSQEDLGDALKLTRSSVSLWEKGRSIPEDTNMQMLADVLKVSTGLPVFPARASRRCAEGAGKRLPARYDGAHASAGGDRQVRQPDERPRRCTHRRRQARRRSCAPRPRAQKIAFENYFRESPPQLGGLFLLPCSM